MTDYKVEVIDLTTLPPGNTVLTAQELAFYQTLKIAKRKTEWLGGRIALKKLLAAQLGGALNEYEILVPGGVGKPLISRGGKSVAIPFSLTHSNGYAVAAVAPGAKYIGIDLEKVTHRMDAWKKDFFHPTELTGESDAFLTALWTQKEAVVKLLGAGLTVNSFDVRCVGGKVELFGRAREIFEELGGKEILVEVTGGLILGFMFSVAIGN